MSLRHSRSSNYPDWFQEVITVADMAETSVSPGCMIIKPWGYGLWEHIRRNLDDMFTSTGHENYYFPMFIPLHFFQKEADHVDGFAKEMALVTHSKLRQDENKHLVPDGELEEPLVVRPTSETIIADAFSRWVISYRDLPILLNQWANVVRWEMRPRMFLRTREFLWQEGHTVHSTDKEAISETYQMLEIYRRLAEDYMAMPVIVGIKPEHEKFPGAIDTYSIEAMMQDGKALQAGTSHFLGQNFAKSSGIKFRNSAGEEEYAYTTSWGVSTRLIGGLIMTHADDEGMNTPPRIAPYQIVIVPMIKKPEEKADIMRYIAKITDSLSGKTAFGDKIRVKVDYRNKDSVDMYWSWARKGVPLIIEVGKRDVDSENIAVKIRNRINTKEAKRFFSFNEFSSVLPSLLEQIQSDMFNKAKKRLDNNIRKDIRNLSELQALFKDKNSYIGDDDCNKPAFVLAKWSGDKDSLPLLKEMGLTMRNYPFDMQDNEEGTCILTGKSAVRNIIISRAY